MDDEMDYVMHHPQESSLSPAAPQPHHQHHQSLQHQPQQQQQQQQQQQIRQCPYWSDHQVSGYHFGPGLHSPSHNHLSNHSHHHSSQASQASQNQGLAPLNNRNQAPHPYDPVHSSIPPPSNHWSYPPPAPPYHWGQVTLPHPRPSLALDPFYSYPNTPSSGGPGGAGTPGHNSSSSSNRGVGGLDPTSTSGPVQPPVVQNQQTPRHEPFNPFPNPFHHQPASLHRFSAAPPAMSAPGQVQQSGQQVGQQPPSFTPAGSEFSAIRLPSLNQPVLPRTTQTVQQQQPLDGGATSNGNNTMPSAISSPPDPVVQGRAARNLPESPRNRNIFDGSPRSQESPPAESDGTSVASLPSATSSDNRRRLLNMRVRPPAHRASDSSDYDSEEDAAESEHERALEILEQLAGPGAAPHRGEEMNDARIRAHQLLRGQMSTKRVASKSALASLVSVDIMSLEESEKTCIICYNDFGVENPEGINEAPLRLPRCKHVFGDHCIKKWFEESDSCPYCRDKVPSEPQFRASGQAALREYLSRSTGVPVPRATLRALSMEQSNPAAAYAMLRESTSDASRYVRAPTTGADSTPPRAWQAGERRSPPSEAQENRRRTRARHGSLRAFTAAAGVAAAAGRSASYALSGPSGSQHQLQSPGRDRFPSGSYRPQNNYNPQDSMWQTPSYTSYQRHASMTAEPLGLNPPSAPNQQSFQNYMPPPVFTPPQQGPQDQTASTGGPMVPSGQAPQPFPGPSSMIDISFGYMPQGGNQGSQANNNRMDGFSYPNAANGNQGNPIPNREGSW